MLLPPTELPPVYHLDTGEQIPKDRLRPGDVVLMDGGRYLVMTVERMESGALLVQAAPLVTA